MSDLPRSLLQVWVQLLLSNILFEFFPFFSAHMYYIIILLLFYILVFIYTVYIFLFIYLFI